MRSGPQTDLAPTRAAPPPAPPCPTCQYDLTGLPDGRCPECGTPFTLASLHAAATKKSRSPEVSPDLLMVAALIMSIFCLGGTDDPSGMVLTWFVTSIWFVLRLRSFTRGQTGPLLWLLLPSAHSALWAMQPAEPLLPLLAAAVGVAMFAIDGALSRGEALGLRFLFTVPAGGLLILGGWMFAENLVDLLAGHHWSAWLDSPYDASQYPPTTREALLWSLPLLGGGLACALLRWWTVRAAAD